MIVLSMRLTWKKKNYLKHSNKDNNCTSKPCYAKKNNGKPIKSNPINFQECL